MSPKLRQQVRKRAQQQCEYCHLSEEETRLPFEVDHIRALKHHGPSRAENLCYACAYCNAAKGPNVAGHDPMTDELVPLFNPRAELWDRHFAWRGAMLEGKTSVGRTTIDVLRINAAERVAHRELLAAG